MARIPILNPGQAQDASLKAMFEGIEQMGMEKFMNQIGTLANHPPIAKAIVALLQAYYFDSVVPRKYLEMAILLVSGRNSCHYCVLAHTGALKRLGLDDAEITEAMAVVDLMNGMNGFADGLGIEPDLEP